MIKTTIELAPEEYWIECTFQEIKMYLFVLTIDGKQDWRLPTEEEQEDWFVSIPNIKAERWTITDTLDEEWYSRVGSKFLLIPVRDLKDD
jgi:hypothetical protein